MTISRVIPLMLSKTKAVALTENFLVHLTVDDLLVIKSRKKGTTLRITESDEDFSSLTAVSEDRLVFSSCSDCICINLEELVKFQPTFLTELPYEFFLEIHEGVVFEKRNSLITSDTQAASCYDRDPDSLLSEWRLRMLSRKETDNDEEIFGKVLAFSFTRQGNFLVLSSDFKLFCYNPLKELIWNLDLMAFEDFASFNVSRLEIEGLGGIQVTNRIHRFDIFQVCGFVYVLVGSYSETLSDEYCQIFVFDQERRLHKVRQIQKPFGQEFEVLFHPKSEFLIIQSDVLDLLSPHKDLERTYPRLDGELGFSSQGKLYHFYHNCIAFLDSFLQSVGEKIKLLPGEKVKDLPENDQAFILSLCGSKLIHQEVDRDTEMVVLADILYEEDFLFDGDLVTCREGKTEAETAWLEVEETELSDELRLSFLGEGFV